MIVQVLDVLLGLVTVSSASGLLVLSIGDYPTLPDNHKPRYLALIVLCSLVLAAGMRLMAVGVWG